MPVKVTLSELLSVIPDKGDPALEGLHVHDVIDEAFDIIEKKQERSMKGIENAVINYFGIRKDQFIMGGWTFAYYRQVAMYLMHNQGYKKLRIGSYLSKDHATVIYGVRQIENLLFYDKDTQQIINDLNDRLYGFKKYKEDAVIREEQGVS